MNNIIVALPVIEDYIGTPCYATDYAVAVGLNTKDPRNIVNMDDLFADFGPGPRVGFGWLAEAEDAERVNCVGLYGQYDWRGAGIHGVGVCPLFKNPRECGLGLVELNGQSVLTVDGQIAVYPKTYAGAEKSAEINREMEQGGDRFLRGYYTSDRARCDDLNAPMLPHRNWCRFFEGKMYCFVNCANVEDDVVMGLGERFRDGTEVKQKAYWFECEPIIAQYTRGGDIRTLELLTSIQFEPEDKFRERKFDRSTKLDINEFQIGRYLNGEFIKELVSNTKRYHAAVENEKKTNAGRKREFTVGRHVKIKCEGRVGVVRRLDLGAGTATLLVDKKPLTYRLDDLTPEKD